MLRARPTFRRATPWRRGLVSWPELGAIAAAGALGVLALLVSCADGDSALSRRPAMHAIPMSAAPRLARFGGASMGTTFTVQAIGLPDGIERARLATDVARILDAIDLAMSTWRADSELVRFNAQPGTDWFDVSADTWQVVTEARRIAALTGGALDVTVGPLVELWGFGSGGRRDDVPAPGLLAAARARIGWERLGVRNGALRKTHADVAVDLSALAKGHAVDRIAVHLERLGIEGYLVELGGELRGHGLDADGTPWRVGIEYPDGRRSEPALVLNLSDGAVATSGDSRNAFERGGRRYGHVIDPRSGWPVTHRLASVSVVASTALHADALATALFVLGPEEGRQLAERDDLAALFIQRTDETFISHRTSALVRWLAKGSADDDAVQTPDQEHSR